ncbi:MAG: DUF3417 domain-containing protein, partial [Actinomycetota bacterium]
MRPLHQFTVTSEVPDALAALPTLASNLHWAWDRELAVIFDRLDGRDGDRSWRRTGQHPTDLVRRIPVERWNELAADHDFVEAVNAASRRLDEAITGPSWFGDRAAAGDGGQPGSPLRSVAYFSPEFGIHEALPQYSGGLGVLAGDHLKASSDLGVPLIGVGLLYAEGYFRQTLDPDGWQHERNPRLDPDGLGLVDTGVVVEVDLAGVTAHLRVWRA